MKYNSPPSNWEKFNQKWYSGCFWFILLLGGLWLGGQIFGSGSEDAPRFPFDDPESNYTDQNEPALRDYDPGMRYDATNAADETAFYLDNLPLDLATSSCPVGCVFPPSGCLIKGNISFDTQEKIYHLPGDPYYSQTKINPDYGERWFCTEQEARTNGWRHAGP